MLIHEIECTQEAHFYSLSCSNLENKVTVTKSNNFFPGPNDISVLVWSNSSNWLKR